MITEQLTHTLTTAIELLARCQQHLPGWDRLGVELERARVVLAAHEAPQPRQDLERTLLEQYDREQEPGYWKGYEDGRLKGYAVGHRHATEQPHQPPYAPAPAEADLREIECPPDPDVVDRALSERSRLSPYDAVARAMDLASLLAGSVGMNNKEQANAYSSRLRRHLIEYVYPATAAEAQAKSEPAALTDAQLDALMPTGEAQVLWFDPRTRFGPEPQGKIIDASMAFMSSAPLGTKLFSREEVHATVRAAIAATQEQKP